LNTVVPSPNWPETFEPQVNNNPSDLIAAVCVLEADITVQLKGLVETPVAPLDPEPQVNSVPPDLIAAVWKEPAATAVQELDPI
jgi:hypothetical protein